MRIIWKDSSTDKRTKRYRGYKIYGINNGWGTTMPDDNNLYQAYNDAFNAIDKSLGGHGRFGPKIRGGGAIRIIGKINEQQMKKEEGLST